MCACVCVPVCVISSYLVAEVIYYREEKSKNLKMVSSFTNSDEKTYNLDAYFYIFIFKDSRI